MFEIRDALYGEPFTNENGDVVKFDSASAAAAYVRTHTNSTIGGVEVEVHPVEDDD